MPSKSAGPAFLTALILWLATASVVWAESPMLVNIGVSTQENLVTMHARLVDGMTDSILEAVESGVPITFTYTIELRQQSAILGDDLVSSNTVSHTVQYDSLKKVYRFTERGKNVHRKIATRNRERYQKMMLTLEDIPVGSINHLSPKETYYVRVKADLETDRLWFPFNYLFFFLPFNDFKASWVESSPLSIDPDLALFKEAFSTRKSEDEDDKNQDGIKHVIRSFNK